MDTDTVSEQEIELYRKMTGEERLSIALDLHEHSCEIAREAIRRQHPEANDEQVEELRVSGLRQEFFQRQNSGQ